MDILRRIADAKGPCITIVEPGANAANLQEALREIEQALPAGTREELITPMRDSIKNLNGEQKGSVVLLRSADLNETKVTGEMLPAVRTVTDLFQLRSLIPVFHDAHEFYLLALSQQRTRLLHCTATTSEEIPFPKDTPASLGDSRYSDKPDHQADKMGIAGPGHGAMKGVMSGVSTEADRQPEYIHNFFNTIDKAVNAVAKEHPLPLVMVGVESELAIYRNVNTYPLLAQTGVLGSPDHYEGREMYTRALRALSTFVPPAMQKTIDELDKLIGTGHASVHAADIVKAAHEGRVAHLFLQSTAEYLGTFDEARGKTSHHAATESDRHDLMEDATRQTILHGGQVSVVTGKQMPNGVPVCAVYRY